MSEPDIKMECIGYACPVQYEGTINGTPFYFRARGERWRMGIGEHPVEVAFGHREGWTKNLPYGDYKFAAGWMPVEEAEEIIKKCAVEFTAEQGENDEQAAE